MARLYQGAFNSGELAPGLWGRVDLDRYSSGLRVARNMFPLPEGGIMKRPGLEYVCPSLDDSESFGTSPSRLIPFKFNNEQTYMLPVLSDRFFVIKNGGVVLNAMDANGGAGTPTVASVSNYTEVSYTTHGFSNGDQLYWVAGGFDELEGRWLEVYSVATDTFRVRAFLGSFALDSSAFSTNATTIDFGEPYSVRTADGWYSSVDVMELDYTQANDTLYVSHPSDETKVITRTADDAWTVADFTAAPSISTPSNLATSAKPTGTKSIWYAITAIDPDTYEESLAATLEVTSTDDPTSGDPITVTWDEQTAEAVEQYRIYRGVSGIYGLVGTAADPNPGTGGDSLEFSDEGIVPNLSIAPPLNADFFNATDEYPGAVELFQQRIWFGRSNNLLRDIYASRSGSLVSFATSTVSVPDDPIEQAIAAKSVQEVKHFVPLRDLVVLTSDAEWGFDTGDAGVLTPDAGLVAQSFWGTYGVKPVIVGESAIFVEKSGKSIRDLAYALQNDGFASSDISIFAKHLFQGRTVVSMCFAQSPHRVLFCVMSDGQAVSCTYVRDQQIFAWARHDTSGKMIDCASVSEGGQDNIYVVVARNLDPDFSETYQIERMRMIVPNTVDQGVWLDNSLDVTYPTSGSSTGFVTDDVLSLDYLSASAGEMYRLAAAEGDELSFFDGLGFMLDSQTGAHGSFSLWSVARGYNGDTTDRVVFDVGNALPNDLVVNGGGQVAATNTVTAHHQVSRSGVTAIRADHTMYTGLTIPTSGVYEFHATQNASVVHVGELYISEFETLDIDSVQDPITGLPVTIGNVLIRLTLAVQYSFGRRRANLSDVTMTALRADEEWDDLLGAFRGVYDGLPFPGWRRDGRLVVRSYDGFPFIVAALIPQVEAGDMDA